MRFGWTDCVPSFVIMFLVSRHQLNAYTGRPTSASMHHETINDRQHSCNAAAALSAWVDRRLFAFVLMSENLVWRGVHRWLSECFAVLSNPRVKICSLSVKRVSREALCCRLDCWTTLCGTIAVHSHRLRRHFTQLFIHQELVAGEKRITRKSTSKTWHWS